MAAPDFPASSFASLITAETLAELRDLGHVKLISAGSSVMHQNGHGDAVLLMLEGHVKVVRLGRAQQAVLDFRGPGELVGEQAILDVGVRSATVQALTDIRAVVIAPSDFKALLARRFDAALQLINMLAQRLSDADRQRLEFGSDYTVDRLASRLMELGERFGKTGEDGSVVIDLPVSQEELASWVGASREATVKALRQLRSLGLIETGRRRLVVVDPDRLTARIS